MKPKGTFFILCLLTLASFYALLNGEQGGYQRKYCNQSEASSLLYETKYSELYSMILMGCRPRGERSEYLDSFYKTGTAHLLTISGLHVGSISFVVFFLINLVLFFLQLKLDKPIPYFLISLPLSFLSSLVYVSYIGIELPRLRALIMLALVILSTGLSFLRSKFFLIALTASIIFLYMPESIYSYSFYYSFAAVTAILTLPVKTTIYVCTCIFVFILPLNLHIGGSFNPSHILANIILVPVFCFVYFPLLLFFKLNLILGLSWPLLFIDSLSHVFLLIPETLSKISSFFEYNSLPINSFEAFLFYVLIACILLFFRYSKKIDRKIAASIYLIAISFCVIIFSYKQLYYSRDFVLRIFDLKKPFRSFASGDILLLTVDDKIIVVDTGHGKFDSLSSIRKIRRLKIDSIDYLILTHRHQDHVGGLSLFMDNFKIKAVVISPLEYALVQKGLIYQELRGKLNKVLACKDTRIILSKRTEIRFLNPDCDAKESQANIDAISFLLKHDDKLFVFSSDLPLSNIARRLPKDIEYSNLVLQMSHHCSARDNPSELAEGFGALFGFCTRSEQLFKRGFLDTDDFNFPIFVSGNCGDIRIRPKKGGFWIFSQKCSKKYLQ